MAVCDPVNTVPERLEKKLRTPGLAASEHRCGLGTGYPYDPLRAATPT